MHKKHTAATSTRTRTFVISSQYCGVWIELNQRTCRRFITEKKRKKKHENTCNKQPTAVSIISNECHRKCGSPARLARKNCLANTKQSKQINNRLTFDSIMKTKLQWNCVTIEYHFKSMRFRIYDGRNEKYY